MRQSRQRRAGIRHYPRHPLVLEEEVIVELERPIEGAAVESEDRAAEDAVAEAEMEAEEEAAEAGGEL